MPEPEPSRRLAERRGPRPLVPLWIAVPLAAIGGVVLDLAYPSVGIWPLAFVGIGLALVTLIGRRAGGALLVGFVFGATFYLVHIMWITRYLGLIPWFALAGLETVFWAVGSILITLAYRWLPTVGPRRWAHVIALPALVAAVWTARELFMGSWPYTGFPWARMGMSQADGPLAPVASWVGVTGLTFLMVMLVAMVLEWARLRVALPAPTARRLVTALPAVALAGLLILLPAFPTASAGTLRVGSVQGNGPAGYFDDREPHAVLQAQLRATDPLVGEELDLVLWPEGGIDSDPTRDAGTARLLDRLVARVGAPLLANAATTRGDDIFNTSFLWEEGADNPTQLHDKRNPVPMGEYVPDRWFYEAIVPDLIGLIQREYTPGSNSPLIDVDGVRIGLAICFDVIYDAVIWEGARDGAQVYMFQTNNADFRDTDENLQQLAFARMRAIETGRSVVNISTVGTSQVIAPDGRTVDDLPADEAGAMLTDVELRTGLTPAVVLGPALNAALLWGAPTALVLLGITARVRRRGAGA